ncbi:MAG: M13 family metallopeptidase, partial [Muribaculaceae bacterium]|nr:M13 family metallopeptidase [Muribaculaceae bacterium]
MKLRNLFAIMASASFCMGMQAEHLKSLDPKGIDPTTPASHDFYRHVNKGWMDSHPLTPEYARYGAFNILNDSSNNRVRRIVTGLAATNP